MNTDSIKLEKFDSEIFKEKIGRVEHPIESSIIEGIIQRAKAEGYKYIFTKVPITEKQTVNKALRLGFNLVDTQIMYRLDTKWGGGTGTSEYRKLSYL